MVVGRSLHRHGGVGRAGGVGPSHYPPPLALPSALSASVRLPSNGSRSIRDETHTFFPRFSEWTRGQRLRTRGPRGPGWETEGGRDLPPARPKANIYPWTTATDTDLDLLHDRGLARRRRGDADAEGGRAAVAERHVITDYSGAAGAIAMPAERRSGSGGLTSIRQTGRTRTRTGRKVDSRGIGNLQSFEGKIFPAIPWKISLE